MASPDVEPRRFSDVMQGHRPLRDPRAPRRFSRKTSEDSEQSPREHIPVLEHKRSSRSVKDRRGDRPTRRASDTALLPPIRVSTVVHPAASPVCDVTGVTSQTGEVVSSASSPLGHVNNSTLQITEREAPSPHNRKDTQSSMSAAETAESNRLSPTGSEKLRAKAERRVLKSVNNVINDITNGNAGRSGNQHDGSTPTPKPKLKGKNRSMSMQALPKLSASEEPFSIRRKIEQFRKWHEEQYMEKLKKLKVEGDKEKRESQPVSETPTNTGTGTIDFAKLLEENMQNLQKSAKTDKTDKTNHRHHHPAIKVTESGEDLERKRRMQRCKSGATWRTWRDVNDSYAYNDVKKYIEENELLPSERAVWIRNWLSDVEKALNTDEDKAVDNDETKAENYVS